MENNRIFDVVLSTADKRIILNHNMSQVIIEDDDSE